MEQFKILMVFVVLIIVAIALYNQNPPGPPGVDSGD